MPRQHVNDIELYDELTGDGDDTVVFVHGSWTDHRSWQLVVPAFVERCRVLSYDRRDHSRSVGLDRPEGSRRQQMRSLLSRFSDWVLVHPVWWAVGWGVVLVLLGFALDLASIVVIAVGAAIGVLNVFHAKKRGYCPLPTRLRPVAEERVPPSARACASREKLAAVRAR